MKLPDDVISLTEIPPLVAIGDSGWPQYRMAMRARTPRDVAKYARTAPVGVVIYCLWAASVRAAGGTPQ